VDRLKTSARRICLSVALAAAFLTLGGDAWAQDLVPSVDQGVSQVADLVDGDEVSVAVRLVVLLSAMTFIPAMILVMTPFTRFVIVFSLLRQALGLQQSPPNQVLIGLSLFLSMLVMQPTLDQVNAESLQPYLAGEIKTGQAIQGGIVPVRAFMLANVHSDDMQTMLRIARLPRPESLEDIPTSAVVSAYMLTELKTAFVIAIKVYIPFLVMDLVVASVLLAMGMMMLPPVIISLPFKLLLFVLMDGWGLLMTSMVASFR
jgi:flagellar biosynthesis protein FliP